MIDFTARSDINAGFNEKQNKYNPLLIEYGAKPILPIVVSPNMDVHPDSLKILERIMNIDYYFVELGAMYSKCMVNRLHIYEENIHYLNSQSAAREESKLSKDSHQLSYKQH